MKQAAVEVVCTRSESYVCHGTAGISEFRIEVRSTDVDGLDSLRRRHQRSQIAVVNLVLDAFDLEIVELPSLPVNTHGEAVLRVVENGMGAERPSDARHEQKQALVVPVEQ